MNKYDFYSEKTAASFHAPLEHWDDLISVLDLFPIPMEVFSTDGLSLFVNKEFLNFFNIDGAEKIVGKLNILKDPYIYEQLGMTDYLRRAFSGEILSFYDIRVPSEEITHRYKDMQRCPAENDMYQDITCFPIWGENESVACVVALFMTKRVYQYRLGAMKAKSYIEANWLDDFEPNRIADSAGLSRDHLARLFKQFIGMTPYSYYQELKIEKIKEALHNASFSVREAFTACGTEYCGGIAEAFKRTVGMTPTQYRKTLPSNPQYDPQKTAGVEQQAEYPENRLFRIAGLFPIPIQIFKRNGDIAFINEAVLKEWNVLDSSQILGKYNLLKDPFVNEQFGLRDHIQRAFKGEIVLIPDIKIPLENFWEWYNTRSAIYDIESIYTDILNFPVWGKNGRITFIVSIFLTSRLYQGRSDVTKAKEYLENHWREDFDADKLAKSVHLSTSHLARLFKKHTGMTLYNYYQEIKINRLKAALRDKNLSITEAFVSCGFEHTGNFTRFFKKKVGMTPQQYRKTLGK